MITTVTLNTAIDKAYYMEQDFSGGTVMSVERVNNTAGGKGLNVARVIKQCGEKVLATGIAGGFNGKYLEYLFIDGFNDKIREQTYHCGYRWKESIGCFARSTNRYQAKSRGIYASKCAVTDLCGVALNTVGCGDTMVGSFAVAILKKYSPSDALAYAVAAVTAGAMNERTGYFEPDVRDKIINQITINKYRI